MFTRLAILLAAAGISIGTAGSAAAFPWGPSRQSPPKLTITKGELSWSAVRGETTYELTESPTNQRIPSKKVYVRGTHAKAAVIPGETVNYHVRGYLPATTRDSNTVTVSWVSESEREAKEKAEVERHEREAREKAEREAREKTEHEETKTSSTFFAGLNAGGWGSVEASDLPPLHLGVVRIDTPSSASPWEALGLKVIDDIHGPYNSGGVSGLNHKEYVERVVAFVKANTHVFAIEVLNEPGGSWFWGSNSESAANRESYAKLLIEVHEALVANFGNSRPLILASWDGGHDSSNAWGEAWSKNTTALADVDGVTNHPYGGTGNRSTAALGNRGLVEGDEAKSHKPIFITEVGFPTKGPTGDSLQYTETEEASAIFNFAAWAKTKGYIVGVTFYNYRDEGEGGGYGIITHSGTKKRAYTALKQFNEGITCSVC